MKIGCRVAIDDKNSETMFEVAMDRTQQALDFITTCCRYEGVFKGTSDVNHYLRETASEMKAARPSAVFPDQYIEYVAYAVDMIGSNMFLSPPAAIAALYLVTRFEFYFRILSGKLNDDGTWISMCAQQAAQVAINNKKIRRQQISNVALTYKIMKLDQSLNISQACTALDKSLYSTPTTVVGNVTIADIGDRIAFGRNAVGHGHLADISAEGLFYGLMTAVVFYNQA